MPKVLGERIYVTTDGKHVREGDPDAAFLAFAHDDEVPDKVLAELGEDKSAKSRRPAANKARSKPGADKGADADGSDGASGDPTGTAGAGGAQGDGDK